MTRYAPKAGARIVVAFLLLLAFIPAGARGATVKKAPDVNFAKLDIVYSGDPGANDLEIRPESNFFAFGFTERVAPEAITATDGCSSVTPKEARCDRNALGTLRADLGGGNDKGLYNATAVLPALELRGGPGNDSLSSPGAGTPKILLVGDAGHDSLTGGSSSETLAGGFGSDRLVGGIGVDTASYTDHSTGVKVTIDDVADDGNASDRLLPLVPTSPLDSLMGVENVDGGGGDDTLIGDGNSNLLRGHIGSDTLDARGGNDDIEANDGVLDRVACGAGTSDSAVVDLKDVALNPSRAGGFPDCESVDRAAVDEHPNVRIARRAAFSARRRTVRVRLTCPRALRRGCRGRLSLAVSRRAGARPIRAGSRRYARIRAGRSRTVRIRISRRAARLVRRGSVLRATARERDRRGRPKLTYRTLVP